jgi:hypothetical protein
MDNKWGSLDVSKYPVKIAMKWYRTAREDHPADQ